MFFILYYLSGCVKVDRKSQPRFTQGTKKLFQAHLAPEVLSNFCNTYIHTYTHTSSICIHLHISLYMDIYVYHRVYSRHASCLR